MHMEPQDEAVRREVEATLAVAGTVAQAPVPPGLHDAVMQRIAAEGRPARGLGWRAWAAAAAVLLIAANAFTLLRVPGSAGDKDGAFSQADRLDDIRAAYFQDDLLDLP